MDITATHGRTAAAVPPVGEPAETDSPADDCFRREAAAEPTSARTPTGGNASA